MYLLDMYTNTCKTKVLKYVYYLNFIIECRYYRESLYDCRQYVLTRVDTESILFVRFSLEIHFSMIFFLTTYRTCTQKLFRITKKNTKLQITILTY